MEPIILASSSPRRHEILKLLNIPFQVIIPNTDETITQGFSPEEASELIARQKISEIIHSKPMGQEIPWILSADTIILFNGNLYGKIITSLGNFVVAVKISDNLTLKSFQFFFKFVFHGF